MPCNSVQIRLEKDLDPVQVAALYAEAGWIKPGADAAFIGPMLRNSFAVAAAFDGPRLVGMMRALSDGVSDAYILDLIVTKEYRRHGLGKRILDTLARHLASLGIDWIVLIGAEGTEKFYASTDAEPMKGHAPYRYRHPR